MIPCCLPCLFFFFWSTRLAPRFGETAREWREELKITGLTIDLACLCAKLVITSRKGVAIPHFGRLERPRFSRGWGRVTPPSRQDE